MKSLNEQVKQVAVGLLVFGAVLVVASQLSGCGKQGPMGPQGAYGQTGASGPQGEVGPSGTPGTDAQNCTVTTLSVGSTQAPNGGLEVSCPDGTSSVVGNGSSGTNGFNGTNGTNGVDGTSCSVSTLLVGSVAAPNGGSLITCSDGTSSVVLNGGVGATGATGNTGAAGTNGTVITPVQFCSGFTQSYPNTFAESGLCVGGVMLGVYSENGGFLAVLPPGTYSSDGINASCTFNIGSNCSVTQ